MRTMIETKHIHIHLQEPYRCIVISDIHSHLDRLQQLLEKIGFNGNDYMIIDGDFVEKGTQGIETIRFLYQLQQQYPNVYILLGNCEYALETLVNDPQFAGQMLHYFYKIGKSGLIDQAIHALSIDIEKQAPELIQQQVRDYLRPYIDFIKTLPTTIETDQFLFVHAGIEKRTDWKKGKRSSFIEMRDFQKNGHLLDQYVVVGHLPTSNFCHNCINNDIMIDHEKRIISIDGGTGVKMISQLNALVIEGHDGTYDFHQEYVQPLLPYRVIKDVREDNHEIHKIAWPHFAVEIISAGADFTICRQIDTNLVFDIKNEFLYERHGQIYCLDDYTNYKMSLKQDDVVELIGIYGRYAYVKNNQQIGWVKADALVKIPVEHDR